MNFKKLMTPKQIKRWVQRDEYYAKRLSEFKKMNNQTLTATARYYLTQMRSPEHWNPADPVYDAVFYYVIVPELLRRLEVK